MSLKDPRAVYLINVCQLFQSAVRGHVARPRNPDRALRFDRIHSDSVSIVAFLSVHYTQSEQSSIVIGPFNLLQTGTAIIVL